MTDQNPDNRARARHMMISLLSFGAAFMAAGAAWLLSARAPVDVPEPVAYTIMGVAIAIFFIGPNGLRKKWRKDDNKGGGQ